MKTMYRAHSWKPEIEAVEVVSETAKFVTIREKTIYQHPAFRDTRRSKDGFFDTWEECKAAYVLHTTRRVDIAKNELQRLRSVLGNWESLKEPS